MSGEMPGTPKEKQVIVGLRKRDLATKVAQGNMDIWLALKEKVIGFSVKGNQTRFSLYKQKNPDSALNSL